jgi:hypothetical protein
MKIKSRKGGVVDTNDLSDIESIIIRKQNELYDLCTENNIPAYFISNLTKQAFVSCTPVSKNKFRTFWNSFAADIFERSQGNIIMMFKSKTEGEEDE